MVHRSIHRALPLPQMLHPQHLQCPRRLNRRLVSTQRSVSQSHRRRILMPNRRQHAHTHPGQNDPSHPFLDLRLQHHPFIHPNRPDLKTSNHAPSTNTRPCTGAKCRSSHRLHKTTPTRHETAPTNDLLNSPLLNAPSHPPQPSLPYTNLFFKIFIMDLLARCTHAFNAAGHMGALATQSTHTVIPTHNTNR